MGVGIDGGEGQMAPRGTGSSALGRLGVETARFQSRQL